MKSLILSHVDLADGVLHRAVRLTDDERLVIEGHDLGETEYEFERTLGIEETARLAELLGTSIAQLLWVVQRRFGTTQRLEAYLEEQGIPSEFWNRIGD